MESSKTVFLEELLWSSCRGSNEEYSSSGIPKELCMWNGPQKEGLKNFPGIPQVVHSSKGGHEEDPPENLHFRMSRGVILKWSCELNFLAGYTIKGS